MSPLLNELVQRIVSAVKPKRIILFGSTARDEENSDSDLDLLIIMPDGTHRRRTAQILHRRLSGAGRAKDIVVVTESDVRNHADNPSLIIYPALRQGKELYREQ